MVDQDVTEEDIQWENEEEEGDRTIDGLRDGAHGEEVQYKQYKEADCRIILNVSFLPLQAGRVCSSYMCV